MSGGARHGIGVAIGLIVTPIIALCLFYGSERAMLFVRTYGGQNWSERLVSLVLLLIAAVLLGLVMGSRVSPLASIVPGVVFTVLGLLWIVATSFTLRHVSGVLPREIDRGFMTVGAYGGLLIIGVALLVASVAPSRWRSARRAPRPAPQYMGPGGPGGPVGPGAPFQQGAMQQPQQPQQPYGSQPPQQQQQQQQQPGAAPWAPPSAPPEAGPAPGAPGYGSGAEQPQQPSPGPSAGSSAPRDEQPGEWTQMYGGDDLRGGGGKSGQ
ncbi:hypothetical protein [Actinomadura sp. 9N407]|uniref:hypothetical protein n=1 Tax=Actinomadura sp. 9N407 TaxID=3375154 RepID=UPI00378F1B11